jgi:hypothetical protein
MSPAELSNHVDQTLEWRSQPGYLAEGGSDFESVHVLLGRFLADRHSPDPLPDQSLLDENPQFQWGQGKPLEKVINSQSDLEKLMLHPRLFREAIAIIEPWEHVGYNPLGEHVRASGNVAYIAQKVADCDSLLFPFWSSGVLNLDQLIPIISSGIAIHVCRWSSLSGRSAPVYRTTAAVPFSHQCSGDFYLPGASTGSPSPYPVDSAGC